jgi:predicted patatin/cPLA2 family phospholipase
MSLVRQLLTYNFSLKNMLLIFLIYSLSVNCSLSNSNSTDSYSSSNRKPKCYVLALEGGGDKGAYQTGALQGLVELANDTEWDVITGISVGALDAAALSIFEVGKEKEAVEFLLENWRNIKSSNDIYDNWWGGPLYGLFFKTGLYDTTPLKKMLNSIIQDSEIKRKFVCGATNYLTGDYETFDEETLNREEYVDAITSSASYPVIFPVNKFRNKYYMDGGVKINLDIASGVNKCTDMGYDDKDIVLDVIMLNSAVLSQQDATGVHPLGVLNRVFEIQGYDNAMRDIEFAREVFTDVNFRYVIAPTRNLPSGKIPLNFSPSQIEAMIKYGYEDAKNVIHLGHSKNFDVLINKYKQARARTHGRRPRKVDNKTLENIKNQNESEVKKLENLSINKDDSNNVKNEISENSKDHAKFSEDCLFLE